MKKSLCGVLLVAGLSAMSCSSDKPASSPGSAPAATTESSPVSVATTAPSTTEASAESTEPSTASSEAPDTTVAAPEPEAGPMIGDDGRLDPGPCAGDNTADEDHGVEADSVKLAMVTIDFSKLAAIGFSASGRDVAADMKVFVDALNDSGGVCGRTIDMQYITYDILTNGGGQACLQATEDRTNLLVLAQGGFPEAACIAQAGTLTVSAFDFTEAEVANAGGPDGVLFSRPPSLNTQYAATIQYALDQGLIQGKKVGVWYGSVFPEQGNAVEAIALPLLDAAGIDYKAFRTDTVGPSDPQGNAILKSSATEFASMGVDVMFNFTQPTNHTGMQAELDAQGLRPQWISMPVSGNTSNELFAKAFGVTDIANGEIYTTYSASPLELDPSNPVAASCVAQFTEATGEKIEPNTFAFSSVASLCSQIDQLAAYLSIAGGELSQESMIAALETRLPAALLSGLGEAYWAPGVRFAGRTMGAMVYDGSANLVTTIDTDISDG